MVDMRRTFVAGLAVLALVTAGCGGDDGDDTSNTEPKATEAMVSDPSANIDSDATTSTTDGEAEPDDTDDPGSTTTTEAGASTVDGLDVCTLLATDEVKELFDANAETQGVMPFSTGYEALDVAEGESFTDGDTPGCDWEVATFDRTGYDAYADEQRSLDLDPAPPESFGTNPFTLTLAVRTEVTDTCLVATDDRCLFLPEVPADGEPTMPDDLATVVEDRLSA